MLRGRRSSREGVGLRALLGLLLLGASISSTEEGNSFSSAAERRLLQCGQEVSTSKSWFASIDLCAPCVIPQGIDECMYDFTSCGYVASGTICEVRCRTPYFGASTIARCPANNTQHQPPLELTWTPPNCSFQECPDPDPLPEGYVRVGSDGLRCAKGYLGSPRRICHTDKAFFCAVLRAELVGCLKIQPCSAPKAACSKLDFTNCSTLAPGASCRVGCKWPYASSSYSGSLYQVHCPWNNTEIHSPPLLPESTDCQLQCPDPNPLPAGYEKIYGKWRCAPGYTGRAKLLCEANATNATCEAVTELQGCSKLVGCADLELPTIADPCKYNLTECRGLMAGDSCRLHCILPYSDAGLPAYARCPATNTNLSTQPVIQDFPTCELSCPVPDASLLPVGYRKEPELQCDVGWHGQVQMACERFANCTYKVRVEGCQPLVPCLPFVLEEKLSCRMQAVNCSQVAPGELCEVTCLPPYTGLPGNATCPANNVDPQQALNFIAPACMADCDPYPPGYMKTAEGWSCAEGWGGSVRIDRADCGSLFQLSGCLPLQPCVDLRVSRCRLNAPDCVGVPAGGSCKVSCPEGLYAPGFTYARCPAGNTDPLQELVYELECVAICEDPDPIPEEYIKDENDEWACAEGFAGNISTVCVVEEEFGNCTKEFNLTGCLPLTECAPPAVAPEFMYDSSPCDGVLPGETCEVRCRAPFHGKPTLAHCPGDNTDSNAEPPYTLPVCALGCDTVTPGFMKTMRGWECAPGYAGNITAKCSPSYRCGADLDVQGCLPIVPCVRPVFSGAEACRFESDCPAIVAPGSTCLVRCQKPYAGTEPTVARCPFDNTDPAAFPKWTRPKCSFDLCPDPAVYASFYVKDPGAPVEWRCADKMTGIAAKRCENLPTVPDNASDFPSCQVQEGILSGCGVPQPCVPLEKMKVWDECMFDNSHCGDMLPNTFCEVKCRWPFVGVPTVARCPGMNIIPKRPVDWSPPFCVRICPDPDPIPPGYEKVDGSWACSEGYIGNASSTCLIGATSKCSSVQVLSGCQKLEPCIPPPEAGCGLNFSQCLDLGGGQSCEVTCKMGYQGWAKVVVPPKHKQRSFSSGVVNDSNNSNDSNDTEGENNLINGSNFTDITATEFVIRRTDMVTGSCPFENTVAMHPVQLSLELECRFLGCPDPNPPPTGYEKVNGSWQCAPGFITNASAGGTVEARCVLDSECLGELVLDGCVPLVSCTPPAVDTCKFDISACGASLAPGSSCQLFCQSPSEGTIGLATCPGDNIEAGTAPSVVQLPVCDSLCKNLQVEDPTGYVACDSDEDCDGGQGGENATGWKCADAYSGNVTTSCFADIANNCSLSLAFSGCKIITKCSGLVNIDPCQYIHSCIPGLFPGDKCEVRCKNSFFAGPGNIHFTGQGTVGECPTDNTDRSAPPVIEWPKCTSVCDDLPPIPTGYNLSNLSATGWICTKGYIGIAVPNCGYTPSCKPQFTVSGCDELLRCSKPELPTGCAYRHFDWARNGGCPPTMAPGQSCLIGCSSPYVGANETATCHPNNTVAGEPPKFTLPNCTLVCVDPDPLPPGYVKDPRSPNGWVCNSTGFLGTPSVSCSADEQCVAEFAFTGCLPLLPCLVPDIRTVDICRFNVSDCSTPPNGTGLLPGRQCNVSCMPPYNGTSTMGICPANNVDPMGQVEIQFPTCTMGCPPPDTIPPGYIKDQNGTVKCAPGFMGTVTIECEMKNYFSAGQTICAMVSVPKGCMPLAPCRAPMVQGCDYNVSNCSTVEAGGSCKVYCESPFVGEPSIGRCPATNTDPLTFVQVAMPNCTLECPTPRELPVGYNISEYYVRADGVKFSTFGFDAFSGTRQRMERAGYFQCAEEYAGPLAVQCTITPKCEWRIEFFGCSPTTACAPLDLNLPPCGVTAPDCSEVPAGMSCDVSCNAPCTGSPVRLTCPEGNTNPLTPLQGARPNCFTECDFVPPGYNRVSGAWDGWDCVDGYIGKASPTCIPSPPGRVCDTQISLTGCERLVDCGLGEVDMCMFEHDNCTEMSRNSSCMARCRAPYLGTSMELFCPLDNVVENGGLQWPPVECRLPGCADPDPANTTGYVKVGGAWECARGFAGYATKRCVVSEYPACELYAKLEGCLPLTQCALPVLPDPCVHNATAFCQTLFAGETCALPCRHPYVGYSNSTAECPANNTDSTNPPNLDMIPEECKLTCLEPVPLPQGYNHSNTTKTGLKYECAHGYAGKVSYACVIDKSCRSSRTFSGCLPLQPCIAPKILNCTYNTDACIGVNHGGQCDVTCKGPHYSGTTVTASCPADNVDPVKQAELPSLPQCTLTCPDLLPPPGHVKRHGKWACDGGWIGAADLSCSVNESVGCPVTVSLTGCKRRMVCKPVDPRVFDVCTYNMTACLAVSNKKIGDYYGSWPGTTCEVSCRRPMTGNVTTAFCPADNTDTAGVMQMTLPSCSMHCPPVAVVPEGYVFNDSFDLTNLTNAPLPAGYNPRSLHYKCAPGYGGIPRVNCTMTKLYNGETNLGTCEITSELSGCEIEYPCLPPLADQCEHDISECRGVKAGSSCQVRCASPLQGPNATFTCPVFNRDPEQRASGTLPNCVFPFGCSPPEPLPEAYEEITNGFQCAPGHIGQAEYECYLAKFCAPLLTLTGCEKLVPCVPPPVEERLCGLDYSECLEVEPGTICNMTCLEGYIDESIILPGSEESEAGNTTTSTSTFSSTSTSSSSITTSVTATSVTVTGPNASNDSVDSSFGEDRNVSNLTTKTTTTASTKRVKEYVDVEGPSCPDNNTDPQRVMTYSAPRCKFIACPDPKKIPTGYMKTKDGSWRCQSGYTGRVIATCHKCNATLHLSGCSKLMPCKVPTVPDVLKCSIDVSNCSASMEPGEECTIRCNEPFVGSSHAVATCPVYNTLAGRELDYTWPSCQLVCSLPDPMPAGYIRQGGKDDGPWQCGPGFRGSPMYSCTLTRDCKAVSALSGCIAPVACPAPVPDRCAKANISTCEGGVEPGSDCEVSCEWPYVGPRLPAACPYNNADPSGGLLWRQPRCVLPSCPEPIPEGYQKQPDGWRCAVGYAGTALASCASDAQCCEVTLQLTGCKKIQPCVPPPDYELCRYDMSECANVASGESCQVRCRTPYEGASTLARCPALNTEVGRPVEWSEPDCQVLSCHNPNPPPRGYILNVSSGNFTCAPGYAGKAQAACIGGQPPGCAAPPAVLSGCVPATDCPLPSWVRASEKCMLDSSCPSGLVPPGGSCTLACKRPYVGASGTATCAWNNTDPGTEASLKLPACIPDCEVPSVLPAGYESNELGYRCSTGYTGTATSRCVVDEDCTARLVLEGCKLLVPCAPPTGKDPCLFDLSGCQAVQPGSFCRVPCRFPHVGGATRLICPTGNTDSRTQMKWIEPYCACGEPEEASEVPSGYGQGSDNGWRCVNGYVGNAVKSCRNRTDPNHCFDRIQFTGCMVPEVCEVQIFQDTNGRPGVLGGRLNFGPAQVNGFIDESQVLGYEVKFADDCGRPLSYLDAPSLGVVPRAGEPAVGGCCQVTRYNLRLESVRIPVNITKLIVSIQGGSDGKVISFKDYTQPLEISMPAVTGASVPSASCGVTALLLFGISGLSFGAS